MGVPPDRRVRSMIGWGDSTTRWRLRMAQLASNAWAEATAQQVFDSPWSTTFKATPRRVQSNDRSRGVAAPAAAAASTAAKAKRKRRRKGAIMEEISGGYSSEGTVRAGPGKKGAGPRRN